jgi:inner membrane protein
VALAPFVGLTATTAVLSHLFADALTPMGVRPFEPHDDQEICFDVARAANPLANYAPLAHYAPLAPGGVVVFIGWVFAAAISG